MKPVDIVGVGLSFSDLSQKYLKIILGADILVGGRRHLAWFEDHPGEKREIVSPLSGVVAYIKKIMDQKKVVVLASGDPLFYGIGQALVKALGANNVRIFPNISTLAACFSHLKIPWNQAKVISLHGKSPLPELVRALRSEHPVFVLTDPEHNPVWVGDFLLRQGLNQFCIWVFERLGEPDERIRRFLPNTISHANFAEPNAVVLTRKYEEKKLYPLIIGAPEHWYEHERGLITKAEVRAITLARLRLSSEHVFWDLGAGSGSVAIEAAIFVKRGQIVAVEKNKSRVAQIKTNAKKFGVDHIKIVEANLPDSIEDLPLPNRVFIGGGGKDLITIMETASERLLPEGRMVINAVLVENMTCALEALKRLGFKTDVVQVQISTGESMRVGTRFSAKNPVWIISGQR